MCACGKRAPGEDWLLDDLPMAHSQILGISQSSDYPGAVDVEIGARVRGRLAEAEPRLTQRDLAVRIDMSPDAFSRALSGKRAFTAVELVRLAEELRTSVHWFVTGEPDPFAVQVAGRHTFDHSLKEHEPIDWDAARSALSDIALAYVQAYGAQGPRSRPDVRGLTPASLERRLRDAVGDEYVRRLSEAIEIATGVDVIRIGEVDKGFAVESGGWIAIVVGETGSWFWENWSIAHELAHIIRGDLSEIGDTACDDPAAERAANAFAAELLLPKQVMQSFDWENALPAAVAQIIWDRGVSTDSLSRRLSALALRPGPALAVGLTMKTQAFLRRNGDFDITGRMQEASTRRFPEHLVAAHRDAVESGRLSSATLGWMLGVDSRHLDSELAPHRSEPDVDWLADELGLSGIQS